MPLTLLAMDNAPNLTPAVIRQRALAARVTINQVLKRAHVSPTTLWLWETQGKAPRALSIAKLDDALVEFERERMERIGK